MTSTLKVISNSVTISTNLVQPVKKAEGSGNVTIVKPNQSHQYPTTTPSNSCLYTLAGDAIQFHYLKKDVVTHLDATKVLKVSLDSTTQNLVWTDDWITIFPHGFALISPEKSKSDKKDTISYILNNNSSIEYPVNMTGMSVLWLSQGNNVNYAKASYTMYGSGGTQIGSTVDIPTTYLDNHITDLNLTIPAGGSLSFDLIRTGTAVNTSANNTYLLISFTGVTVIYPTLSINYTDVANKTITSTFGTLSSHPIIVTVNPNIINDPVDGSVTGYNEDGTPGLYVNNTLVNGKVTFTTTTFVIGTRNFNFFYNPSVLPYLRKENTSPSAVLTYNTSSQTLIPVVTLKNTTNNAVISPATTTADNLKLAYDDNLNITITFTDSNNNVYNPDLLSYFDLYVNDVKKSTIYNPKNWLNLKMNQIESADNHFLKLDGNDTVKLTIKTVPINVAAYTIPDKDIYFDVLPIKFLIKTKNSGAVDASVFGYGTSLHLVTYPVTDSTNASKEPTNLSNMFYNYKMKNPPVFTIKDHNSNNKYTLLTGQYINTSTAWFEYDLDMLSNPLDVSIDAYNVQTSIDYNSNTNYTTDALNFTIIKHDTVLSILGLNGVNAYREYNVNSVITVTVEGPTVNYANVLGKFKLYDADALEISSAITEVIASSTSPQIQLTLKSPENLGVPLNTSKQFTLKWNDPEYNESSFEFTLYSIPENIHMAITKSSVGTAYNLIDGITFNIDVNVTTETPNLQKTIKGYYYLPGSSSRTLFYETINSTLDNQTYTLANLGNSSANAGLYKFHFECTMTNSLNSFTPAIVDIEENIYKKDTLFVTHLQNITKSSTTLSGTTTKIAFEYTESLQFKIAVTPAIAGTVNIYYFTNETVTKQILTGTTDETGNFTSDVFTAESKYFSTGDQRIKIEFTPTNLYQYNPISETHSFNVGGITGKTFSVIGLNNSTVTYLEKLKINIGFVPLSAGAVFTGNLSIQYENSVVVHPTELSFTDATEGSYQTIEFINPYTFCLDLVNGSGYDINVKFIPSGANHDYATLSTIIHFTVIPETITLGLTAPTTVAYGQPIIVSVLQSWPVNGTLHLYAGDSLIGEVDLFTANTSSININGNLASILNFNIDGNYTDYTLHTTFTSSNINFNNVSTSVTQPSVRVTRALVYLDVSLGINNSSYLNYKQNGISLLINKDTLSITGQLKTQYTPVKGGTILLQNSNYSAPPVFVEDDGTFSITVPITSTTFKTPGNIYLHYTNSINFKETIFNESANDTVPGVYYLTIDYVPYTIDFNKNDTSMDWHDGLITFESRITPNIPEGYPANTDTNGSIVYTIYEKDTSKLMFTQSYSYTQLIAEETNWTINPKTIDLPAHDYYISCAFSGIVDYYESFNTPDIDFTVVQTVPAIKLRISDDVNFGLASTGLTVTYKQKTYINVAVKSDLTIDDPTNNNILGVSTFTYYTSSPESTSDITLVDSYDTSSAHGTVSTNQITNIINTKEVGLPLFNACATNYTIKCTFTPTDDVNYTSSTSSVTLKVNKYTPVISSSLIHDYTPLSPPDNLTNNTDLPNSSIINGLITYDEQFTIKNKITNSVQYAFGDPVDYGAIAGMTSYGYRLQNAVSKVQITPEVTSYFIPGNTYTLINTGPSMRADISLSFPNSIRMLNTGEPLVFTIPIDYNSGTIWFGFSDIMSWSSLGSLGWGKDVNNGMETPKIISRSVNVSYSTLKVYKNIYGLIAYDPPTSLTVANHELASINNSTTLNDYTWTALANPQKIDKNDTSYNMYINFTPTDLVNYTVASERTDTFSIYTANALGTVDINLDINDAKQENDSNTVITFDQKSSVEFDVTVVFNANVLLADRKGTLKLYKDGYTGTLINTSIAVDESGTTKNPYKTTINTSDASHTLFTADFSSYIIYATLTPTSTNYPKIHQVVSRTLQINPRVTISTVYEDVTSTPDVDKLYLSTIKYSRPLAITATILTGNTDTDLTGKVSFTLTKIDDNTTVYELLDVAIVKGASGKPAYATITTLPANIANKLLVGTYKITCNAVFNNHSYLSSSDDGRNVQVKVLPQPVAFKISLIDSAIDIVQDFPTINNFLYKSLTPAIVVTFYTKDSTVSDIYGGTIVFTVKNITAGTTTEYTTNYETTVDNPKSIYPFTLPSGLPVGKYQVTASYSSPNFGTYDDTNLVENGTNLIYSITKNNTSITLVNPSGLSYVSSQSIVLSATATSVIGDTITGNDDIIRFTILKDKDTTLVKDAKYSSGSRVFATTAVTTLNAGAYQVMAQYIGNESYIASPPVYTNIIIPDIFSTVTDNNYNLTLNSTTHKYSFTIPNSSGDTIYLYMNKQLTPFQTNTSSSTNSVVSVNDSEFLTGKNVVYAVVLGKDNNKETVYNTVDVVKPKLLITSITVVPSVLTVVHKSSVKYSVTIACERGTIIVNEGLLIYTIDDQVVGQSLVSGGLSEYNHSIFMNASASSVMKVSYVTGINFDGNNIVSTTTLPITKANPPTCSLSVDTQVVMFLDEKVLTLDLSDHYINGVDAKCYATFYNNMDTLFENVPVVNGKAVVKLVILQNYSITATFNGTHNYNSATSNSLVFEPTMDTIANKYTSITSTTSVVDVDGFITMTVTAVPALSTINKSLLLNNGTVTFSRSDMLDITESLIGGVASVILPKPTPLIDGVASVIHPALSFVFTSPYVQ